jgi:hypothetical protein
MSVIYKIPGRQKSITVVFRAMEGDAPVTSGLQERWQAWRSEWANRAQTNAEMLVVFHAIKHNRLWQPVVKVPQAEAARL